MRGRLPGSPGRGHRTVPHTADVRIEAWAPTREECFAEAVRGMVEGFADTSGRRTTVRRDCHVGGRSDEEILLGLLDEVIYRLDTAGEVPVATEIRPAGEGVRVRFTMAGVESLPAVGAVPKAASSHGLTVQQRPDGWVCSVTVDV
jgi:SHS2 domain-containing protein